MQKRFSRRHPPPALPERHRGTPFRLGVLFAATVLGAAVLGGMSARAVEPVKPADETIFVSEPRSGAGAPFSYTRRRREHARHPVIYDLRYPSPVVSPHEANNTVPAELYLPAGARPNGAFPAVICLHILNGNFELSRAFCARLAEAGVIALFFKQPYYGERGGNGGREKLGADLDVFLAALDQGVEDARRGIDILQALPEVDPQRIGITGISLGALQAVNVCGREPRIRKAFLTLVGSDIRQVIETSREMRDLRAALAKLSEEDQERFWRGLERFEPLRSAEALRRLAARDHLRMVVAEKDRTLPPEGGLRLAEAAGCRDGVILLKGLDHYTAMAGLPDILDEAADFFGTDRPPDWRPPADSRALPPVERLGRFLRELANFLNGRPGTGRAHLLGAEITARVAGKTFTADFAFARSGDGRFKLNGTFPEIGSVGLGRGRYPWLAGAGELVFVGSEDFDAARTLTEFIDPAALLRFRMAAGVLAGAGFAPESLKSYITLTEVDPAEKEPVLELAVDRKGLQGTIQASFARFDNTPRRLRWDFGETRGAIRFTHWRLNAPADDSMFDPPPERSVHAVAQEDLMRMFSVLFQFLMESFE